jgi:hypothetical protein
MPRDDEELESHLADRLKETRDVANFSRPKRPDEPVELERVVEMPDHLGGRKISDKFIRGGKTAPPPSEAPKPKGLEHHLKSRLSEIEDVPLGQGNDIDRLLESYRKRRREMGGS